MTAGDNCPRCGNGILQLVGDDSDAWLYCGNCDTEFSLYVDTTEDDGSSSD